MTLTPGTRLGPYEVTARIGAGGMGEVYKATDTNLKRPVAIKVLPASVAADAERLARFQREAEVLAALNHPNVAAIYGLERSRDTTGLVMELVEGEELSERIARGAIPFDEALPIAKQITEALEAAHEQGIIHRDLKPANIKLRPDGTVKVLDFGLAKALEPTAEMPPTVSQSPTITTPAMMTGIGVILGTAAYMSPEQARGRTIDRRADIWAFGAVLFEMLTGKRAFEDEDVSMTLSKVLQREPDFDTLPPTVPARVSQVLRMCLRKDPKQRVGDIRDVRLALDGAFETASPHGAPALGPAVPPRPLWMRALRIAAAIIPAAAITATVVWNMKKPPPAPVVRFVVPLPAGPPTRPAFTPDGHQLAYLLDDGQLMLRSISSLEARPVVNLNLGGADSFVFSPDGHWIAFFSPQDRTLKKIAVAGGSALTICKVGETPRGQSLSWSGDRILFSQTQEGIVGVSANGGEPEVLAKVTSEQAVRDPQIIDNGSTLLYTLATQAGNERWDKAQIVVQSLRSGERKVVLQGGSAARYVPTGHLVYAVSETLLAVPFDLDRREVRGSSVPIVEGVRRGPNNSGAAYFSVSNDGSLVYALGPATGSGLARTLAFLDRSGNIEPLPLPPQPYYHPRISPDGKRLVVGTDNGKDAVVMIHDLTTSGAPRRLTFVGRNTSPIWTPDGQRVTFLSDREGDLSIFSQPSNGAGVVERLTKAAPGVEHRPEAWTRDGSALAFLVTTGGGGGTQGDIWTMSPSQREPKPLVDGPFNERFSAFSPNNRWLAYTSTEVGGRFEVFVEPFPPTGGKYQISTDGGQRPVWSPDGNQLFYYQSSTNRIVGVDIQTSPAVRVGKVVPIPFTQAVPFGFGPGTNFDIHPDGKRFVIVLEASDRNRQANQIQVVLNWTEELKRRVPTK